MAYDYATALKQPQPAQQGSEASGFDYAAAIKGDQADTAQPGAMLAGEPLQMPEYEEAEAEELSFMEEIEEMWTGKRRRTQDWAEVPVNVQGPDGQAVPIQDMMSLARENDLARAQIFKTQFPDAEVDWDENLNPYTTYFGEPRYLNRPGVSMGDMSEAITTLPAELLMARYGANIGKLLGYTGQILGAGGALFGTSAAQDKFAQIYGSDQPVDWKRAQMMGLFGAGGEAVGMMAGKFFTRFFGSRKYVKKTGEFTKKGRRILEAQGIDPDAITKEFRETFISMIDDAVEPGAAVTMAEAETLPKRVRLTKGDVTRDVRQQSMEDSAERGALGEQPYKTMDEFRRTQRDELVENRDLIQAGVGQTDELTPTVAGPGEGMVKAQAGMQATRSALHSSMKSAYEQADRLGMRVDIEGVRIIRDHIMDALRTFPRRNNPVRDELLEMNQVVQRQGMGPRIKQVTIKELEDLRARLTSMTQSADPQTAQAARVAVRALDEGMESAVEMGAYTGNVDALRYYQRGIAARKMIGNMFERDELVRRIMEPTYGPSSALKRPPDEAANLIFSGSALGFKVGSENALKQIKRNLLMAGQTDAWNAIREEAIWRLFKPTVSADIMSDGTAAFSGKKLATAMDKAFRDHKRIMNLLFSPEEQQLLRQFRNVAVNATTKVKGAENYSNTMMAAARLLESVFGKGARLVSNAMKAFQTTRDFVEQTRTSKIVIEGTNYGRGVHAQGRRLPPGYAGGLSAIGAAESDRRRERMTQSQRRRLTR